MLASQARSAADSWPLSHPAGETEVHSFMWPIFVVHKSPLAGSKLSLFLQSEDAAWIKTHQMYEIKSLVTQVWVYEQDCSYNQLKIA